MSFAKLAVACGLSALVVSACGTSAKPVAGTIPPTATTVGHAQIDDPRSKHADCVRQHKLAVADVGRTWLQIGTPASGPVVNFTPTPGSAQQAQIGGQVRGAEVIGSALLYPKQSSDHVLQVVEDCLSQGVKG